MATLKVRKTPVHKKISINLCHKECHYLSLGRIRTT